MPEDATPTIVIEAKIFAQPLQGVSPIPQTVRFGEESVAAEASPGAFLAPRFGSGRTVLSKVRILLTASFSAGAGRTDVGRRATTVDAVRFTRLEIRNQSRADGSASLTNSPGAVRNPRDPTTRQGNTHFEDFSRT
jgi:hypothetical protein